MNVRLVVIIFYTFFSYQLCSSFDWTTHPAECCEWVLDCEFAAQAKGISLEDINRQNLFGYTVLDSTVGAASTQGSFFKRYPKETVNMIKFLLTNKADPNIKNPSKKSPFFYLLTRSFDSDSLIPFFIEHKADPNQYDQKRTPLHYCDDRPMSVDRLKLLLEYKANPCLTVKKSQYSVPYFNLVDGQYPYEATEDRGKQNLLLRAIPLWILSSRKNIIMTFFLCMNIFKNDKNTKYLVPPRVLQHKILDISSPLETLKIIKGVEKKDMLNKNEKENIKEMIDRLVTNHCAI